MASRIVVLDGYTLNPGDNPWDAVARLGDLTVYDRTPAGEVIHRARSAHIVLTNKTPLSGQMLAELPELGFISVLATGHNIVDGAAARARNIPVSNVPEYGTDAVAQHVFALILELAHEVGAHHADTLAGAWHRAPDFCFWRRPPLELTGLTLGIVGFGRIGRRVGELGHAFGMRVMAAGGTRRAAPDYAPFSWCTIEEVFAAADVVSLHCPLTASNEKFVNASLIDRMRGSAMLINTARGGLIDEQALADALNRGRIAGAAVDVVSVEPIGEDNPLLGAPTCIITPHMAWGSLAARRRLMATTVLNVEAFLSGSPINVVN